MNEIRNITPNQLKARLDKGEAVLMIDIREDEEVAAGMIPGAKHIVMGTIPERLADIPKDQEVILVCRSGSRSSHACAYLQQVHGYDKIVNLTGGMLEWNQL